MGYNLSAIANAQNAFAPAEPGLYYGYVKKGEVKTSSKGNEYINFQIQLKDMEGNKKSSVFFMFFTQEFAEYRNMKFLKALGFELTGELELEQIAKLAENKDILVQIKQEEDQNKNIRATVDTNGDCVFAPVDQVDYWDAYINKGERGMKKPWESEEADFMNIPEGTGEAEDW